jgi:pyruvate kinase
MGRTKIVATLEPASNSPESIGLLIKAGTVPTSFVHAEYSHSVAHGVITFCVIDRSGHSTV